MRMVLSPDERSIAWIGRGLSRVFVHDLASRRIATTLAIRQAHNVTVRDLGFAPDGSLFTVQNDSDCELVRWDIPSGKELWRLPQRPG